MAERMRVHYQMAESQKNQKGKEKHSSLFLQLENAWQPEDFYTST